MSCVPAGNLLPLITPRTHRWALPSGRSTQVVVFSKSYCPYCTKAKNALSSVGAHPKVYELDLSTFEGFSAGDVQAELGKMTGATSVPRVFVNGKFIGGGDDTARLAANGQLAKMLA